MTSKSKNYYCETCDKTFRAEDDLIIHEAEHETCGEEGCEFTAHPKIIEKHIKMQHETGLYRRIGNLYSDEEIAKWIEERKKRYPSRKVIEEKKALEEKKQERGERIKADENRFNKSFIKRNQNRNKTFEKKPVNEKRERVNRKPVPILQPTDENVDWRGGIPPFTGIGKPSKPEPEPQPEPEEPTDTQDFSDDEWVEISNNKPAPALNSLSLIASYASDEESSDNNDSAPEEVNTVSNKNNPEVKMVTDNEPENENLETPHENKIPGKRKRKHNHTRNSKNKTNFRNKKTRNEHNEVVNKFDNVPQRSLTLLEKLLSKEIRHERNVILQCVRYVIQNNFFQN